jgi:hypothetical protein
MPDLEVQLSVEPAELAPDGDALTIFVTVVNRGDEVVDTQLAYSKLLVDGEPSLSWGLAIGNGVRDARESALGPGERVHAQRSLGRGLVSGTGSHELVLDVQGARSAPATIVVR